MSSRSLRIFAAVFLVQTVALGVVLFVPSIRPTGWLLHALFLASVVAFLVFICLAVKDEIKGELEKKSGERYGPTARYSERFRSSSSQANGHNDGNAGRADGSSMKQRNATRS